MGMFEEKFNQRESEIILRYIETNFNMGSPLE